MAANPGGDCLQYTFAGLTYASVGNSGPLSPALGLHSFARAGTCVVWESIPTTHRHVWSSLLSVLRSDGLCHATTRCNGWLPGNPSCCRLPVVLAIHAALRFVVTVGVNPDFALVRVRDRVMAGLHLICIVLSARVFYSCCEGLAWCSRKQQKIIHFWQEEAKTNKQTSGHILQKVSRTKKIQQTL